jgi:hypothetical protein
MSVVATVKVYDGIVLGAESMTQITMVVNGQQQLVKSYENAQKIFKLGNLGILTYGIGNIGRHSIESYVDEFRRAQINQSPVPDIDDTTRAFFEFMQRHHRGTFGGLPQEQQPALGFLVAGYSTNPQEHLASEWEFLLPHNEAPVRVRPQEEIGSAWRGVQGPFTRLMFGVDPTLVGLLTQAAMPPEEIERFKQVSSQLATSVIFDGMPLQDAIGFCRFLIQTTVGWCSYAAGQAACGGPIKIAAITRNGFNWVTPPEAYLQGEK